MLKRLFGSGSGRVAGERMYAAVVSQARQPAFYARLGVADEIDARFELYTLHMLLLVMRLRDDGEAGREAGQALFDVYVAALDDTLRELGVGDTTVPKKMRKLGEQLYGRMATYEPLLKAGDEAGLSSALARNVYDRPEASEAGLLSVYALKARASLENQKMSDLSAGRVIWPNVVEGVAA